MTEGLAAAITEGKLGECAASTNYAGHDVMVDGFTGSRSSWAVYCERRCLELASCGLSTWRSGWTATADRSWLLPFTGGCGATEKQ